jgi:hypothetical protein
MVAVNDAHRDPHTDAYREWRDEQADEFATLQHQAFLAGFEAAAEESENFRHLRRWIEDQRDDARQRHDESRDVEHLTEYHAYVAVLVKLSEMGCGPEEVEDD